MLLLLLCFALFVAPFSLLIQAKRLSCGSSCYRYSWLYCFYCFWMVVLLSWYFCWCWCFASTLLCAHATHIINWIYLRVSMLNNDCDHLTFMPILSSYCWNRTATWLERKFLNRISSHCQSLVLDVYCLLFLHPTKWVFD